MKKLEGKVAIVTGSTSGIGSATAMLFAEEGAKVEVVGRNAERGNKVVDAINAKGGYGSTKAAIVRLTKCLASEFAKSGVRVNVICPGIIDTPLLKLEDASVLNGMVPLGRIGQPEDIAKAALFSASSDSSWMTGSVLVIDGGHSM